MPEEEQLRWKAEVHSAGILGWMLFCYSPGRAEAAEAGDAGMAHLCCRRLHRDATPVYRSPLLSASGGSAFAAAPGAPPGSGRCSAESWRVQRRQM